MRSDEVEVEEYRKNKQKEVYMTFSPQANYTDWAAGDGQRSYFQLLEGRGVLRGQRNSS
jgi:hypothetical protein